MPLTFYSSTHDLKNTNPYFYITSILLSLLLYCFFQNIATLLSFNLLGYYLFINDLLFYPIPLSIFCINEYISPDKFS